MYAPDATVTIADRVNQPGSPRVLHGRGEIAEWIEDTCDREMTHAVKHSVLDEHGAAAVEMMRTIKRALDPAGIFNPGKVLP